MKKQKHVFLETQDLTSIHYFFLIIN